MDVITFSKLLIVFFVGSVTFWYVLTPYLVQPHPEIVKDILTKTTLTQFGASGVSKDRNVLNVENWTKWRLYVNTTVQGHMQSQVVYGNSAASLLLEGEEAVINMEWRPEYTIKVTGLGQEIGVQQDAPPSAAANYGIYNHFIATPEAGNKVKVVPRFLFGLPYDTVDSMYGSDVDDYPIIGVFTSSPRYDRILIQAYMNIVTLSVIFLLWANNPPSLIKKGLKKE